MRLNDNEKKAIIKAVKKHFEPQANVFLFGSRIDDSKRGGDIDLYIETRLKNKELIVAKLKTMTDIQLSLGDRKIDIVTAEPDVTDDDLPLIIRKARETGIALQ